MGRSRFTLYALVLAMLTGCASDTQKVEAIGAVNERFRQAYEMVLHEKGTRSYRLSIRDATAAMAKTLGSMEMRIEIQDASTGFLQAAGPAPRPLSDEEWAQAVKNDEPVLKQIVAEHVGLAAIFVRFEPRGLETVITATAIDKGPAADISLTMRLREIAPVQQDFPRREYPPPTAVSMGLDKIWAAFERETHSRTPG